MTNDHYFSERESGEAPKTREELSVEFWHGYIALIRRSISDGSLAERFPEECFEAPLPVAADQEALGYALQAEVPEMPWPLDGDEIPDDLTILDSIEFFARHVSLVTRRAYHGYASHDHFLSFDREEGLNRFIEEINRLFRRCRHPFELTLRNGSGGIRRIGPVVLEEAFQPELRSGEAEVDRLISLAIREFRDPDHEVRRQALEHLWDAWERLKTIRSDNKREGIATLIQQSVESEALQKRIDREGSELTEIGNTFRIRHSETDRHPIEHDLDIDYLFHRMYAVIRRLVRGYMSDTG